MLKDIEPIYCKVREEKPLDKNSRCLILAGSASGLGLQPTCLVSFGEKVPVKNRGSTE